MADKGLAPRPQYDKEKISGMVNTGQNGVEMMAAELDRLQTKLSRVEKYFESFDNILRKEPLNEYEADAFKQLKQSIKADT